MKISIFASVVILVVCAIFVFLGIKEMIAEKSWNDFYVKKTNVVQESLETHNSPFFVLNNIK